MMIMLMAIWMGSIIFLTLNHPLSLGGTLLILTILTSLYTGMLCYNYWFSYILFLIMIGGMLILFIYMTSVASNEKFKFNEKNLYFYMVSMLMILALMLILDPYLMNLNIFNYDMINQSQPLNNVLSMNKFMNLPSMLTTLMLIIYLLITLIAVVKITEISYGPMRQKF